MSSDGEEQVDLKLGQSDVVVLNDDGVIEDDDGIKNIDDMYADDKFEEDQDDKDTVEVKDNKSIGNGEG